jgi:hypothetical protein
MFHSSWVDFSIESKGAFPSILWVIETTAEAAVEILKPGWMI